MCQPNDHPCSTTSAFPCTFSPVATKANVSFNLKLLEAVRYDLRLTSFSSFDLRLTDTD